MPIDFAYEFKELKRAVPKFAKTKREAQKHVKSINNLSAHEKLTQEFHALDNMITSELMRMRAGVPQKYAEVIKVSPRAVNPDRYERYHRRHDWVFHLKTDSNFHRYARFYGFDIARQKGGTQTRVVRGDGSESMMQVPVIPVVDYSITEEGRLKVYRVVVMHETEFEDSYDPRTDPLESDLKSLSDAEWERLRVGINKAVKTAGNAAENVRRQSVNAVMPRLMQIRNENIGEFSRIFAPIHDYFYGKDKRPYPSETPLQTNGTYEEGE